MPQFNTNRTRDHLANERTYLAWMRSAIALIGFGLVIVRLRFETRAEALAPAPGAIHLWEIGLVFCLSGLLAVLGATIHYFHIQNAIENDTYQPERRWIVACSAIIFALGLGVVWYLLSAGTMT